MSKIAEFQTQNGLEPDGVLGKKTFDKMKAVWKINTDIQLANFLGQICHESGNFTASKENLNYSPQMLSSIFKKYFPSIQLANMYARQPQKIANKVYANRMGNGDEASGDGWKYIGAGGLQITGANNYKNFSKWIKSNKELTTAEIANKYFWETGLYFFEENKLWGIASKIDRESIEKLSLRINGGKNGLDDRIEKTNYFYNLMNR